MQGLKPTKVGFTHHSNGVNVFDNYQCFLNYLEAGLLNNSSSLAAAVGVTKFTAIVIMNLVTLCYAA
jgi:hypothetical protein